MKKRLWFVVLCVFALVGLTSCLDSVQAISYNDGQYYWYMKLSLSKALMEMAGEDPKVFFEELDNSDLSDLPDFVCLCEPYRNRYGNRCGNICLFRS